MTARTMVCRVVATALLVECVFLFGNSRCNGGIIHSNVPSGGRQIVFKNLDLEFLGGLRGEKLTVAEPCREYFTGLTNLASGSLLSNAKVGGWRYPITRGTNVVGTAVLNADAKTGKVLGFNSLQRPGFAEETVKAIRIAEKLPQVAKHDYEVRFINVPAANFVAVWLHRGGDDILIPLPPTFERMNAYQAYSEDQIKELLLTHTNVQIKPHESNEKKER